jgi:hypothetical protein
VRAGRAGATAMSPRFIAASAQAMPPPANMAIEMFCDGA